MDLKKKLARLGTALSPPEDRSENARGHGSVDGSAPATGHATAPRNGPVQLPDGTWRPAPAATQSENPPDAPWRPAARLTSALSRLAPPGASDDRWKARIAEKLKAEALRSHELRGLPVAAETTPHGLLHRRACRFGSGHRHGRVRVAEAAAASGALVSRLALDATFAGTDFSGALMLDLETTGLAGGTGTLPIVIGLGFFEAGEFVVEQLFLRRPGEEPAMLERVAERLGRASCLVTYNGRSFDWPLLRNRFVMNRLRAPEPPPHLDLLHTSRRVFRHLEGGRLIEVERSVIGHQRVGDVDGSLIPELYFRYLRSGNAQPLAPALEHNVADILLLAALLADLSAKFAEPRASADPRELLGFAQVAFRARDDDRALRFAKAARVSGRGEVAAHALVLEARLSMRAHRIEDAVTALRAAMPQAPPHQRPELHLAIAKLCEHRLRDLDAALEHAKLTLAAEGADANERRLQRLERRRAAKALRAPPEP